MKLWKSAVNGVVAATARSTCASPRTSRRTVIPCAARSVSSILPPVARAEPSRPALSTESVAEKGDHARPGVGPGVGAGGSGSAKAVAPAGERVTAGLDGRRGKGLASEGPGGGVDRTARVEAGPGDAAGREGSHRADGVQQRAGPQCQLANC